MRLPNGDRAIHALFCAPFSLPPRLQRLAAGRPIVIDGQTLDPQMQIVCNFLAIARKAPHGRPLEAVRREFDRLASGSDRAEPKMARTVELRVPGAGLELRVTMYVPAGAPARAPAVLFFHGGGFVLGSARTVAGLCHRIADATKAIVLSVDYRLAPEHPFPAAVEDALAAYRWVLAHGAEHGIDVRRVAAAGDSAGGCIAATLAILVRDEELPPLRAQWLIYPITDWGGGTRSRKLFAHGFLLDEPQIEWFHRHYLPGDEVDDFRASPLRARSLAGLPPALVSTAGFDPLRDEGEAYAARLAREGTRAVARRRDSLIHGFAGMRFATSACAAVDEDIAWLKAELDRA